MHRGVSARQINVKTYLPDRKMPCSTYQTHGDPEVRASSGSLRRSSLKADMRDHHVKYDKICHWTDSSTVLLWRQSAHKKQQVFVANRAKEILKNLPWINGDIENPADVGIREMSIEGLKETVAPDRWRKVAKAVVPRERSWSSASYQ